MHRLMVEENTEQKGIVDHHLFNLPKPCEYFDLIGGTGTGECVPFKSASTAILTFPYITGVNAWPSSHGYRHGLDNLSENVFSDLKKWAF
jgi:hypothetical protein